MFDNIARRGAVPASESDRGVSPVIGVILMVAITVILAAVIATFVMNMGPSNSGPPNVDWEWSTDGTNVTLSHEGGDGVKSPENIRLTTNESESAALAELGAGQLAAGSDIELDGGALVAGGDDPVNRTFTLLWEDPGADSSQVVAEYDPER